MKKILHICSALLLSLQLSGCVLFYGYAPPVQQGNELPEGKVKQLHVGMTRTQVENILGSPVYTTAFSNNRLNYVYTYQVYGKRIQEKRVIVYFRNGAVSSIQRDLG